MLNMRLASCGFLLILLISAIPGTALAGSWTTYTDAGYVSGLAARGNDLWAGTNGGVLHWDLVAGTYVKYTTSEGLADQIVKEALIDVAGNRWFGTTEGVQKFDGAVWTTYNTSNSPLPNNTVYAIAQDLVGTMWFGTAFGCASFDGVDWEVFTNLGGGATNVAVRGIGVDSQNHIWTANNPSNYGDPGGVSMYDGSLWTRYDPDPRSIGQYFLSLAVDLHDGVWAGSWTNWVFMYDGSSWTHYDSGNSGLVGTNIEYVAVEDDNTVWIANHAASPTPTTGGVARYDGSWTTYTPANSGLPDRYVYSIAPGNGEVYFGTGSSGCAGFDGVSWDYYVTSNDPHTQWTTSIARGTVGPRGANTYFGTEYYGIAIFDGNDWSSYTTDNSGLGDNYINDVHVSDGILWTGSQYSGLYKFDGAGWVNYHTGNSGLLGNMILSIDTDSQGNLWLGTSGWDGPMGQDGALAKFDGTSWTNYYLSNSSLIDDDCLQVAVDATDMIWIGTEEGVSKFDGGSNWTNYDTGNSGLIENHVQAIAFGLDNSTWFATWGGVSHLSGLDWVSYTTADGLPSNTIRDICVTGADVVWVATAAGAASFEGGIWTAHTQTAGLADDDVTATGVESDDRIWFGTRKSGISVYDGGFTAVAGSEVLA
ncbi:MAG: hypothetical protein KAW17_08155, partial [Candidatus Eisenbacteria sp.]|nr:hypothetical protein [Candidatus Eisenbacteria bacterium]